MYEDFVSISCAIGSAKKYNIIEKIIDVIVSIEITSLKCLRAHTMCWNKFLECSETFVSAILASRVKIRTLNYDAVPEDPYPSSPVSIFCSLLDFPKNIFWGNRTKMFFKLDDSSFLPGFERIGTSSDRSEIFSKKY